MTTSRSNYETFTIKVVIPLLVAGILGTGATLVSQGNRLTSLEKESEMTETAVRRDLDEIKQTTQQLLQFHMGQ